MKGLFFSFLFFVLLGAGCAHPGFEPGLDPAAPRNEREAFPSRDKDPRWGIIINEGTVHLNLFIYAQGGRLIETAYLAGANRRLTVNGRVVPRYWVKKLDFGWYRMEIFPFYYRTEIMASLFGKPSRYRVDLPRQGVSIYVGHDSTATYDWGYGNLGGTYRHWGWILRLNGGHIPETAGGLPWATIEIRGNFK